MIHQGASYFSNRFVYWIVIREKVIEFLDDVRATRDWKAYSQKIYKRMNCLAVALRGYCDSQNAPSARPRLIGNCADYAFTREVKAVLEDKSDGLTRDGIIDRLSAILPALTEKWSDQCSDE